MDEWLRRWTSDLMGTLRAGSIPGTGDFFFLNLNDEGGASLRDASARRARALIHMRSTKPEGECEHKTQSPRE